MAWPNMTWFEQRRGCISSGQDNEGGGGFYSQFKVANEEVQGPIESVTDKDDFPISKRSSQTGDAGAVRKAA
jgi:hypothetical protein